LDWTPLWLSLRVAGWATVFSFALGLPIALGLARALLPGRAIWEGLANLPLVLPPTVLGYALLVGLGRRSVFGQAYEHLTGQSLVFTWQGAVVATCIVSLPLFIGNARVALAAVDPDILGAARTDGAGRGTILVHILLPLARPGLVAGTTLAFARALGDFGATLMVAGDTPHSTQTMPLAIYDAVYAGDPHTVLVFVGLSVAVSLAVCVLAARLTPRE
jgi:molybdate transport system permease protein